MNRADFPAIGPGECRRYIAQARATPNAIALRIHYLMHAQRARDAGHYSLAAAILKLMPDATNSAPASPAVTCSNAADARGAGPTWAGQI